MMQVDKVYPKFKPPTSSNFWVKFKTKNISGSICGGVWKTPSANIGFFVFFKLLFFTRMC